LCAYTISRGHGRHAVRTATGLHTLVLMNRMRVVGRDKGLYGNILRFL
jgi:hypothetical protein